MPIGRFPTAWDVSLRTILQNKIANTIRQTLQKIAVRKEDIVFIATKFLKFYREILRTSGPIQNLSIPSSFFPGPLQGYNVMEAKTRPLWGMIGIPVGQVDLQFSLIEKIRLGNYAKLSITRTGAGGIQGAGFLEFDFAAFRHDSDAIYHDGTRAVSWVELVEYGFNVPGYLYLPRRGIAASRSGHGIMAASQRYNFAFGATHVFEEAFEQAKAMLMPQERMILAIRFRE